MAASRGPVSALHQLDAECVEDDRVGPELTVEVSVGEKGSWY